MESLAAARSAASMGNEPSDAIRVVNAVLTQIDKLRHRNNVLLLATSNISQSIDVAFIGDVSALPLSFCYSRLKYSLCHESTALTCVFCCSATTFVLL